MAPYSSKSSDIRADAGIIHVIYSNLFNSRELIPDKVTLLTKYAPFVWIAEDQP